MISLVPCKGRNKKGRNKNNVMIWMASHVILVLNLRSVDPGLCVEYTIQKKNEKPSFYIGFESIKISSLLLSTEDVFFISQLCACTSMYTRKKSSINFSKIIRSVK